MEWRKIENKWHEMALRLQTVSPRTLTAKQRARKDDKAPDAALLPAPATVDKSVLATRAIA